MLFAVLNALDLLTTWVGGIEHEGNPVGQLLIGQYGFLGLVAAKGLLLLYFLVSTALLKRMRCPIEKHYRALVTGLYIVIVAWNVRYLVLVG